MPLGAARLTLLARSSVAVAAEVIRKKQGIQAVGNAQINTAQYKFGGASALFDGTGDYLATNITSSYDDDFTIETWVRLDVLPSSGTFRMLFAGNSNTEYASIANQSGTYVSNLVIRNSGGSFYETYYTIPSISTNTWYHWAVVKSGSTIKHFFAGTELTTLYSSTGTMGSDYGFDGYHWIARWNGNTSHMVDGYMDEIRISSTARYTSSFTPDTLPFVNDDDTLLLIHCDGSDGSTYFDDDNGVRGIIPFRAFGNAQIDTSRSVFGGSSLLLDGTGDYIKHIPVPATGPFYKMNQTFTAECWFNKDTDTGDGTSLILSIGDGSGGSNYAFSMAVRNFDNKIQVVFYPRDDGLANTQAIFYTGSGSATIVDDTWNHFACAGNGSNFSIWLNGTRVYTVALTNANGVFGADGSVTVGANFNGALSFNQGGNGWLEEVRISTVDRYGVGNSSITVPTAPFVPDSDTPLLLHLDGTDGSTLFLDDNGTGRSRVGVSAIATAQVDTAQSYFGGSSALFNPSSLDHLLIDDIGGSNNLDTNWTFECWYRPNNRTGTVFPVILANHTTSWGSGDWGFFDRHNAAPTKFTFFINAYSSGSPALESTTVVSNGTWYHLAVVKEGNDYELFVDGTSEDTLTTAAAIATNRDLRIGSSGNATSKTVDGHIDEIRISNTARYTTGFTPSTTPFQNDANTKLLLHCDGSDGSTDFVDDNGKESA